MIDLDDIYEEEIINIYNISKTRYDCLKGFVNLILNDILNSMIEKNYDKFIETNDFLKDKINNLDEDNINNEDNELINKYNTLKNIINNIYELKDIQVNLSHLIEILNEE